MHFCVGQIFILTLAFSFAASAQAKLFLGTHAHICATVLEHLSPENNLMAQGFPKGWYEGADEAREFLSVADELRKPGVDPRKTHIPFLERQLEKILHAVQVKIWGQKSERSENHFQDFKFEFENQKRLKNINYRWSVNFAYRLSILVVREDLRSTWLDNSPEKAFQKYIVEKGFWLSDAVLEAIYGDPRFKAEDRITLGKVLDQFPQIVMLPNLAPWGLIPLSRTGLAGVVPLSVIPRGRQGHGHFMRADEHVWHEVRHVFYFIKNVLISWERLSFLSPEAFCPLRAQILTAVSKLDFEKRLAAEFVLTLLVRELDNGFGWVLLFSPYWEDKAFWGEVTDVLAAIDYSEVISLVPLDHSMTSFVRLGMEQIHIILKDLRGPKGSH